MDARIARSGLSVARSGTTKSPNPAELSRRDQTLRVTQVWGLLRPSLLSKVADPGDKADSGAFEDASPRTLEKIGHSCSAAIPTRPNFRDFLTAAAAAPIPRSEENIPVFRTPFLSLREFYG